MSSSIGRAHFATSQHESLKRLGEGGEDDDLAIDIHRKRGAGKILVKIRSCARFVLYPLGVFIKNLLRKTRIKRSCMWN